MTEPNRSQPLSGGKNGRSKLKLFGCIGIALIISGVIVVGIFSLVIGGLYFGTKSTEEFKCAIAEVRKNEKALAALGSPIEDGYLVIPNIEISGSRREVYFSVPLTGPKGSGTLNVSSYRDQFRSDFMISLESGNKTETLYKGTYPCGPQ